MIAADFESEDVDVPIFEGLPLLECELVTGSFEWSLGKRVLMSRKSSCSMSLWSLCQRLRVPNLCGRCSLTPAVEKPCPFRATGLFSELPRAFFQVVRHGQWLVERDYVESESAFGVPMVTCMGIGRIQTNKPNLRPIQFYHRTENDDLQCGLAVCDGFSGSDRAGRSD